MTLIPFCLHLLVQNEIELISDEATECLAKNLRNVIKRAGLLDSDEKFLSKTEFKKMGYLGSGGIGRFRDSLWASSLSRSSVHKLNADELKAKADQNKTKVYSSLNADESDWS